MSENISYLDLAGGGSAIQQDQDISYPAPERNGIRGADPPSGDGTTLAMQQSVAQLGQYLTQMGSIMLQMQHRLDQLEAKERLVTLSHDDVKEIQGLIRNRCAEYCEKYELRDLGSHRAISGAIKRAVLRRYGVKDLHDVPAIARLAVEYQISKWADIRLAMKCREKSRAAGGGA